MSRTVTLDLLENGLKNCPSYLLSGLEKGTKNYVIHFIKVI